MFPEIWHCKCMENNFVSRGGIKLQAALDQFQVDVKDQIVLDVGSSTDEPITNHINTVKLLYGVLCLCFVYFTIILIVVVTK